MAKEFSVLKSERPKEELFTIAEAFFPAQEHSDETGPAAHDVRTKVFEIERNIRAVSMLIFHLCEDGNKALDASVAIGFSGVLDECAKKLAELGERIAAAAAHRGLGR